MLQKNRIRINLDLSKELADLVKQQASKQDMTVNALIRIILTEYFNRNNV